MPITAPDDFTTEAGKWRGARPFFRVEIDHGGTTYDETALTRETGHVDRLLEKWGGRGISIAADVQIVLANKDGRFNQKELTSPYYPQGLIGDTVRIYMAFKTYDDAFVMSDRLFMSESIFMASTVTEQVLLFTGIVTAVRPSTDSSVSLRLRDAVQDLLDGRFSTAKTYTGDPATIIRDIVVDAGLSYNATEFTRTQGKVQHVSSEISVEVDEKYMDVIEQVTVATGLNIFTDELNQIVIFTFYPDTNDFAKFTNWFETPLWSHDKSDRDYLNVINAEGSIDSTEVQNRVILNYIDINTDLEAQVDINDATSIAAHGERAITIDSRLKIDPDWADVWPERLLDRYKDPRRTYTGSASLVNSVLTRIGDWIRFTSPILSENEDLFLIRRKGVDFLNDMVQFEIEDMDDIAGVKFAWVSSDIVESDGNRISSRIDHLHNKSFESAENPGVDDTPTKWTTTAPAGGTFTFERSADQALTGRYAGKVVVLNATGSPKSQQSILLRALLASSTYKLSFNHRGTINSGGVKISVKDSVGAVLGTVTISSTSSTWTLVAITVTTGGSDTPPYLLVIEPSGTTDDLTLYLDDIQIDDGVLTRPFQVNWKNFAFVGEEVGATNPGFDLDGNANNVINGLDYLEGFEELPKVLN